MASTPYSIHQLKITLKRGRPPIWRRFQVNSSVTLYSLHRIVQTVVGWTESHLWEFRIGGVYFGEPHPQDWAPRHNARAAKLNQVAPAVGSRFLYAYDFGDDWEHEILVEKILPSEQRLSHPVCLAGKRACPPEDCGGIPGYANMLYILGDPTHEEYAETLEWLGGAFDPEEFDLDLVNLTLKSFR